MQRLLRTKSLCLGLRPGISILRGVGKCGEGLTGKAVRLNHSSAKRVRQEFIDFFANRHEHSFVRSSSVIPHNDPTLAFVNAGMNQFKQVFLGTSSTSLKRAVNSQKCIRVGGKHNDLDEVGRDGYHHTFFEMLGSWSFNDYFKKEACMMAWDLLTKVYRIPVDKLFVTYFAGNERLNIAADEECRDIWLSLGVKREHILPFGAKDNFWEMGPVGPCGPCTEIHVNKANLSPAEAAKLVNAGTEDVVEIWNLVFIQYNRLNEDTLLSLPARHVDTGMGLERLVAYLQKKTSNYDTDLFMPIITAIHKVAGGSPYSGSYDLSTIQGQRDYGYRLLADHSRMITVALADGAFPDSNHRLRRVIRQAILASQQKFSQSAGLLVELTNHVAESLGEVYPEIWRNLENAKILIQFEDDLLKSLISKSSSEWKKLTAKYPILCHLQLEEHPGIVSGFRELERWSQSSTSPIVPGSFLFKLHETFGLGEQALQHVALAKNLHCNWEEYSWYLDNTRKKSQQIAGAQLPETKDASSLLDLTQIPVTDTNCRYSYTRSSNGAYEFPKVRGEILFLTGDNGVTDKVVQGQKFCFFLDKTNMYAEAGGQVGDTGIVTSSSGFADVLGVTETEGRVCHTGLVREGYFSKGDLVELVIDEDRRLNCMANHTATHLLHSALRTELKVTCQKSSHVSPDALKFDFGLFSSDFGTEHIRRIENHVRNVIKKVIPVRRNLIQLQDALQNAGLTLLPGEVYPEEVNIISVEDDDFRSLEPCCGTHVLNTGDIEDFCIVSLRSSGVGSRSIKALTRSAARKAQETARALSKKIHGLHDQAAHLQPLSVGPEVFTDRSTCHLMELQSSLMEVRKKVSEEDLPVIQGKDTERLCDQVESLLRAKSQEALAQLMRLSMEDAVRNSSSAGLGYVIQEIKPPEQLLKIGGAKLSLIKATRWCQDKPVLVFTMEDGCITGKCCVPSDCVTESFSAEQWAAAVKGKYPVQGSAPKGQNAQLVFNFRSGKIPSSERAQVAETVRELAAGFANKYCCR